MKYSDFVKSKLGTQSCSGIARFAREYPLFPHQQDLAAWALRRGRAAIFADTGLGKSRMQLAWADTVCHETKGDVLILAPLAVAEQTVEEGRGIGVAVKHVRDQSEVAPGINITMYARLKMAGIEAAAQGAQQISVAAERQTQHGMETVTPIQGGVVRRHVIR